MRMWRTKSIHGIWVYGSKHFDPGQRPKTWTAEHTFTLKAAQGFFDQVIRPAALIMNGIRRGIDTGQIDSPLLVPHNPKACEYVGKFCDAAGQCGHVKSPIKLSSMSIKRAHFFNFKKSINKWQNLIERMIKNYST